MRRLVMMVVMGAVLVLVSQAQAATGSGSVDMSSGWYAAGAVLTNNAAPDANSQFDYWTGDISGAETSVFERIVFTVDGPKAITANFSHIYWDIEALAVVNGAISPTGITAVPQSSNEVYTITPAQNYHILDVEIDGTPIGATNSYTFSNVSTSHTIWASFEIDEYQIVFDLGTNGTLASGTLTQMVAHGSSATAPTVTPDTGYNFDGWDSSAYTNVTAPLTINAQYSLKQYTLTIASVHGTGDPVAGVTTNDYGTELSATMVAEELDGTDTKYVCAGWLGAGSVADGSTTNTGTFTLTADTTITWQWTTNYYITFGVQGQ